MRSIFGRNAAAWLAPCLAYIAVAGVFGITAKLALEEMAWQELMLWTTLAYMAISAVMLIGFRARLRLVREARWGALSGVFIIGTFVTLSLALAAGDVTQVIPVAASYPVFTVALAALILRERITPRRLTATGLVIAGVIVVSI